MTYDEFKARMAQKKPIRPHTHPEEDLQRKCVEWFRISYPELAPLLFHPNNEPYFGGRGKTEKQKAIAGARAKQIGVVPGVADLILMMPGIDIDQAYPPNTFEVHGLCIELKTRTGRQSDTQKQWQKAVEKQCYRYEVVRSFEQFKSIIIDYLGIPPQDPEQAALARLFGPKFNAKIHKSNKNT